MESFYLDVLQLINGPKTLIKFSGRGSLTLSILIRKKQSKTNADNKEKSTITHTLGRKSYARLYEELETDNPECGLTRAMAWKAAHRNKKTGEVLPCAAEKFALMEAAEEKQKSEASLNGENEIISLEDFETDPVAEVFGDDKRRSYCRAISSTSTVKQVKLTQAAKAIVNYKENANEQWRTEMQNSNNQMHEKINTLSSAVVDMKQFMKIIANQIGGNMVAPRTEVDSNTEHNLNTSVASFDVPSNDVNGSSTRERQTVMLLSRDLKEVVAKGHLGMQKICHGRMVVDGEKIVWVDEILDPDAPLFEAPQNGHYTLSELVGGGFVIWPEYRLRYL